MIDIKIGDIVYFETEFMYCRMYPSGHTEITKPIDGEGIIIDIMANDEYLVNPIYPDEDLPDNELFLHVEDIIEVVKSANMEETITDMAEMK